MAKTVMVELFLNGITQKEEVKLKDLHKEIKELFSDIGEEDSVHLTIEYGKQTRRMRPGIQNQITTDAHPTASGVRIHSLYTTWSGSST